MEFLDFECEACGAAYPAIEQLREQYAGRVSFVLRYFPLEEPPQFPPGCAGGRDSRQARPFEAIYNKMFQTQADWGEQQVSQDELFPRYAADLGWIWRSGTPTTAHPPQPNASRSTWTTARRSAWTAPPIFFVNGRRLEPRSFADLTAALNEALAR